MLQQPLNFLRKGWLLQIVSEGHQFGQFHVALTEQLEERSGEVLNEVHSVLLVGGQVVLYLVMSQLAVRLQGSLYFELVNPFAEGVVVQHHLLFAGLVYYRSERGSGTLSHQ